LRKNAQKERIEDNKGEKWGGRDQQRHKSFGEKPKHSKGEKENSLV